MFQLKNGNREWQQLSSDNVFNITNLPPGRYQLTLTVMYPGKIYPDKSLHWSFTIQSPLWKRWWFILLTLLTTFAIIWAVVRAYYLKKLAVQKAEAGKQQAIEKERNRISRDMHDDLGSGLTKIAILSEVAKKQMPEPEKAKEQLEKISQSSRELVDSLQDIIWVLNPANDTLESLAAYIREYTLKFVEPFSLETGFDYPDQFAAIQLSEEKRRNVFLTVKESLHNIARHAHCTRVDISITEEPGAFTLLIRDNGRGFDTGNTRMFGNGLKNMENRISQAGGNYQISSAPEKGTLTIIRMPV
ncbi:MAG: ATP-binding protein [Chitinophagaceae bacterium]|nr:ATP-binding protein [Chitinophagaceae bacterium]